ncbi:MAG: hypothetical protein ABR511_14845 [Acidimicrobiales bacterium]
MHPYVSETLAEDRRRELASLAAASHAAHEARVARARARSHAGSGARDTWAADWRRAVGRGLVAAGLRLGLPGPERAAARCRAHALLDGDELAFGDC